MRWKALWPMAWTVAASPASAAVPGPRSNPAGKPAVQRSRSGSSLMHQDLRERRQRLAALPARGYGDRLALSEGVVGMEKAYFAEVCQVALEGIVAKRLDSRYQAGKHSAAWIKIKPRRW
jgi:ATP dependent DNA ligase domain